MTITAASSSTTASNQTPAYSLRERTTAASAYDAELAGEPDDPSDEPYIDGEEEQGDEGEDEEQGDEGEDEEEEEEKLPDSNDVNIANRDAESIENEFKELVKKMEETAPNVDKLIDAFKPRFEAFVKTTSTIKRLEELNNNCKETKEQFEKNKVLGLLSDMICSNGSFRIS